MRRRDGPLIVERCGDLCSQHAVERAVFHALAEVLREVLGSHTRGASALSIGNERDSLRARTVPQPRTPRVSVVEPRRDERNVRVHVPEPIAPRRHLPDERVRHRVPEFILQPAVEPAPPEPQLLAVAHEVAAVLHRERHQMDDGRLARVAAPRLDALLKPRRERVGEPPRHPAAAARSAVAAEPPRAAAVPGWLAPPGAATLHPRPLAPAPFELPAQRPADGSGARRGVPGPGALPRHRREPRGPGPPRELHVRQECDSEGFGLVRQKLRLRAR